ncbi:protein mono-ADP-ribosyltransferase PARP15-like isoform X1 [Dendronephthya gigantea]|uniref:protein mono-ADP-ribosyltransferase PARP15-like isoform X1 n=1 Tax=Dendronephthya gigantea TaxID=151771 RepID=UPI0010695E9E|nr:protein mono-ADP-ribosyltransferase PARP15-like isoform X1 [Dendronephthya gigantea]
MKKQASTDATKAMISLIEKKHKCVIKTEDIQREKIHEKSVKVATNITHGAVAKETVAPTNSPTMHVVNDKEIKMSSGQRITMIVGNLAMQKVDVIVNTTNDSVDLNANACGKALLKVAGDELLKECKKIGSLKAGDMASTGPGNLNCKRVYHVRSSSWDSGKGSLILRKLIRKCLDQLEKDRFTSIAIPAIGTGNLHFPRSEVANVFFEEVGDYLIGQPQSPINDIRFVAYSGDQQTVDAFLGAVQNIKSPPSTIYKSNAKNPSLTEKPDGSLELFIGSKRLKVQIVRADITKERTNVIMHVIAQDFSFKGGVINALTKAGGDDIVRACKALGKPAIFSTHYTTAGKLAADQIAHVIAPSPCKVPDLKKCLDVFLDDIQKKNIAEVSFSAIGAGAMGFPERDVVDIIFGNLLRVAELQNSKLNLVRIVIMDKEKFGKFKDATKAYVLAAGATPSSSQPVVKSATKTPQIIHGKTITIYSDEGENIVRAWGELESKMSQNIENMTMNDDVIKKFTDHHLKELRKLSEDNDVRIVPDVSMGNIKIKGHIADVSNIQEKIRTMLKKISDDESKVPDYWDKSLTGGVHKVNLSTKNKEYKEIEDAFKKTAPNEIVRIDRIQNRGIYELYNVKRQAMKTKYGRNFPGKELMLFHGTSSENIDTINSGGLNRNFAGIHATRYGRGVYFARDASYSCQKTFSPADSQGHRYMYYAKVLVGDFTVGTDNMIVAPNKNTTDPNETYNSVVDNVENPKIYVLFQDYEYYTEYLITFK